MVMSKKKPVVPDNWKTELADTAAMLFCPRHAFYKLLGTIMGAEIHTPKVFYFPPVPILDYFEKCYSSGTFIPIENSEKAERVGILLNALLRDAAERLKTPYAFEACINTQITVFKRNDFGEHNIFLLYDHLREVKKHIQKTGRTLFQQVDQQQSLFREKPDLPNTQEFSISPLVLTS
jgi:hypothetical protein